MARGGGIVRFIKLAQNIPSDRVPRTNTPYFYVVRAVDATSTSGGKEYFYVVYRYSDGQYGLIGWHGSLNALTLRAQWKGLFNGFERARLSAVSEMRGRVNDPSKHYVQYPFERAQEIARAGRIPGIYSAQTTPATVPQSPSSPVPPSLENVTVGEWESNLHTYTVLRRMRYLNTGAEFMVVSRPIDRPLALVYSRYFRTREAAMEDVHRGIAEDRAREQVNQDVRPSVEQEKREVETPEPISSPDPIPEDSPEVQDLMRLMSGVNWYKESRNCSK